MIFIYEDAWENFQPLSLMRPVSEIKCGALSFREKIERLLNTRTRLIVRDELLDLLPALWPQIAAGANHVPEGRHLFVVAGTLLTEPLPFWNKDEILLDANEQVIGVATDKLTGYQTPKSIADFLDSANIPQYKLPARRINYPWEIFPSLELELRRDFKGVGRFTSIDTNVIIYGDALRVEENAVIEAGTIIDTRKGPVTVGQGSVLKGHNFIEGPCYIGANSVVDSARLRAGSVLGPVCRVGGEVEASIFHGYVNKHHEGFIGHSYLGEWVNLGAMTTNSDLKNNYSEVKVRFRDKIISTGTIKFGCIIGDHTKTSIGTLIPTGAIIGIFANILGGGLCSKNLASFSWGETERYNLSQLTKTVEKVMSRRDVELSEDLLSYISLLYQKRAFSEVKNDE